MFSHRFETETFLLFRFPKALFHVSKEAASMAIIYFLLPREDLHVVVVPRKHDDLTVWLRKTLVTNCSHVKARMAELPLMYRNGQGEIQC